MKNRIHRILAWTLLALGALASGATPRHGRAQTQPEPSRQPVLRIETGRHTAPITRISTDAAGRYLVTASQDKTARVWELTPGQGEGWRLVRVLRPPIGEGDEGKLYAVALSPDGRTVAVGGFTGIGGEKDCIYLFDRESGRLQQRISGLPNVVFHLVYSPDGKWLAATVGVGNGVRIYAAGNSAEAFADREYGADSYGADFDAAGRLVTTCDDGYLRLYERRGNTWQLAAKRKAEGGNEPFAVRFAPDGRRLAVGFRDSTRVAVLSGNDLKLLYAPDTSGVDNGNLGRVAWTADGQTLAAGGSYDKGGPNPIRLWSEGGRGAYREVAAADNTIMDIHPWRAGGLIYGATDPAWGMIEAGGKRTIFCEPELPDYRGLLENFLLSGDGARLQFSYEIRGKAPARFALAERRLTANAADKDAALAPPRTTGLNIADWHNNLAPKFNGQPLKLRQYEMSRSLAIASDQSRFLLGASFGLRLYDRAGKELWQQAIPGIAWSVNLSGNGKLATAAFGDGTIRWYRVTDGRELLAFFPHPDKHRWVLWTPQGYYDASPGAEDLIGWHVNKGADAEADFFPVSQFRGTYYRPDVISRVLTTLDEAEALRLADADAGRKRQEADLLKRLPPVVEILSPADGVETSLASLTVRYRVRTAENAPVKEVRALVDGRPVATERRLVQQAEQTLTVPIPSRDLELSVIAENQFASSVPATIRVKWRGRTVSEDELVKPKLYVLAVGVSKYKNPGVKQLEFADDDARDFAAAWMRQKGGLYRDVVLKVLTDEQATKDAVLDGFEWIKGETTSRDLAVIFLAGHGENDNYGDYFFCPHDIDPNKTLRTGIAEEIKKTIRDIAGKVLVFMDTCRSGNALSDARQRANSPDLVGLINELSSAENGAIVFAAATGRQASLERKEWGHGAFTLAVIEGLSGKAARTGNDTITIKLLDLYVAERVKELTGGKQAPVSPPAPRPQLQNLPIALRR